MPVIDMAGLNTQIAPMDAVMSVLGDYQNGFTTSVETLDVINAIVAEWRQ